ncbi:MAG: hypothetical protein WCV70_01360 [Patescibacteria group bacterium]|jgi:hypothetical protein
MFLTKKFKFIFISLLFVLSFLMVAQVGLAAIEDDTGLNKTATGGFGNNITKTATLSETIGKIVGVALSFLGVAFFILIIYGGYMWMFSMGNEQTAGKAKDIIIAAVIGLVIVLMAYAITTYLSGIVGK